MRYVSAAMTFVLMFAVGFFFGGWILMPHLPPVPDHIVHVWELEYWTNNWAGVILGLAIGIPMARSSFRYKPRSAGV